MGVESFYNQIIVAEVIGFKEFHYGNAKDKKHKIKMLHEPKDESIHEDILNLRELCIIIRKLHLYHRKNKRS